MGSSQRLAAVAAVSHAKHYYNHTQPEVVQSEATHYTVNIFFVSATLCGVLVAVCAACWRRTPSPDKPDDVTCAGVYTVSNDARLTQAQTEFPGPPPAYETVVEMDIEPPPHHKDCLALEGGTPDSAGSCSRLPERGTGDGGLPSYEAAVLLRDTKL